MLKQMIKTICSILITVSIFLIANTTQTYATVTIAPYMNELIISNKESVKETFTFTNNNEESITVKPVVYAYDPLAQELLSSTNNNYIFVETDWETFTIEKEETITFTYTVKPASNLENGTYFNLIVLENTETDDNVIGINANLSHLVVMHITEDTENYTIPENFANIEITITDEGIPFIKPTKIKYTLKNTTNYVLKIGGEIQVYNKKGGSSPEYIDINKDETKIYTNGSIEEEFSINTWNIKDVLFGREIVGRFYNGIDNGSMVITVHQNPHIVFIALVGLLLIWLFFFIKSLIADNKRNKKEKSTE